MRSQDEIMDRVNYYKEKLANAMMEKEDFPDDHYPELDLIIFSLVDKLETLFWVLEVDLPEGDILDRIVGFNH